jgi:hypothetical protein
MSVIVWELGGFEFNDKDSALMKEASTPLSQRKRSLSGVEGFDCDFDTAQSTVKRSLSRVEGFDCDFDSAQSTVKRSLSGVEGLTETRSRPSSLRIQLAIKLVHVRITKWR